MVNRTWLGLPKRFFGPTIPVMIYVFGGESIPVTQIKSVLVRKLPTSNAESF